MDPARRDALRAELVAHIPRWYSPLVHLAFPSLCGLLLVAGALWLLRDLAAWQLVALPISFVILNAGEWRVHRDLLHRRTPPLQILYDRHTPEHHMIFVTEDMSIRDRREFRLVLIPFYGILAAAAGALPIPVVLWLLGQRNLGLIYFATAVGYTVLYEWLHLIYHLPPSHPIGGLQLVARLRRHHAIHHDPQLMQKWNFNVTIPLWDWVRRTIYKGYDGPVG
jgi:sterol desaturase/sphingolipid hydroxylase (fatty acid hydroxylase superfamily)